MSRFPPLNGTVVLDFAFWSNYAAGLLGVSRRAMASYWNDAMEGGELVASVTGTNTAAVVAASGGQMSATAGDDAAAGSVAYLPAFISGVSPFQIANLRTSKYVGVGRFKHTTVAAAGTIAGTGITDNATQTSFLGVNGTAANYTFVAGGTTITSTIVRDTAFHYFVYWNDGGTNFRIAVDGEAFVAGAVTNIVSAAGMAELGVVGAALQARQTVVWDYFGLFTPRT